MSGSMQELRGKKVTVVGLGRAGTAAASYLVRRGCHVVVTDTRSKEELREVVDGLPEGIVYELGGHCVESFRGADLVVVSPGVPEIPELRLAREAGVRVVDEVQLAAWALEGQLVGITGTNGKSTTTVLLGEMLQALDRPLYVGGNLGTPLIKAVQSSAASRDGLVVAELSSFQLGRSPTIAPYFAVLLNIAEDHLDRHADMEEYIEAKAMIFRNQPSTGWALVNGDDEECLRLGKRSCAQLLTFRDGEEVEAGGFIHEDELVIRIPERAEMRIPSQEVALSGRHNLSNALVASIVAASFGVDEMNIRAVLKRFQGLPHRMQRVGRCGGVVFFNDSKATNVSSAVGSLSGLQGRFVVIAGGKHKGSSYAPLREVLSSRGEALVLIGEAAEVMERELKDAAQVLRVADMSRAVSEAWKLARNEASVVLCPACSSYDMYENYERRGEDFTREVQRLIEEERC